MAGQSITFDFLTTGADRTASGFRKVGDNTVLAARGAKVLSDAIEKLGQKEDRTAAESVILAKALRQTGDAEDRVAARAVVADAAIRRLDDSMQDANKHSGELGKTLSGLKLNPGLVGPLLALAPAIATLGGVGAGAAAGLGGAFIAGGAALAAFGAVAKPVLSDAKKAAAAVETAQGNYNAAIAAGTKQSVAYKAEQLAIAKAYAGMSPAQVALSGQLGAMADAWDKVKAAQTPVVAGALQPWLKSVTGLTASLGPIIAKIAPVIQGLGNQFGALVSSSAFTQFRDFIGSTGAAAVSAGGSTIIDLVKSFMILLPKFDPLIREAVGWISRLGPAVLAWSSSKKASDDITKFLQWFSRNGPAVGGFLKSIGAALAALAPGLASGGALELKVITDFLNFVARLPPGLAKPLAEVAGAMLILQKTGVVSVGIKLTGLAAGASGAGAVAGPFAAAGAAIAGGIILEIRRDISKGWKTAVADLPKLLEGVGSILNFSASGWANTILDHFAAPVRKMWDSLGHFLASSFDVTRHQIAGIADQLGAYVTGSITRTLHQVTSVWNAMWGFLKTAFRNFVVNGILGPLGTIVHGAAIAFGWIPGIGGKLQGAAKAFDTFRNNVNASLGGINNKTVNVSVAMTSKTNPYPGGISGRAASGMYVSQGTGPTADDVLIRASRGELIVPTRMVNAGAVDHLRGRIPGFAGGGVVVAPHVPSAATVGSTLMASVMQLAQAFAKSAQSAAAAPGSSAAGGGGGAARWSSQILTALAMLNQSPSWLGTVERRMNQESGGNPAAVNRWDSNWARGTPSVGVMQVIGPTYQRWSAPGWRNLPPMAYGTSEDVLANTYAGLHYALNTYGSLAALNRPGGYARGGLVPGYASGGVAGQGAAYLKAWQTRHGGPYALAVGPKVLNEQIPEMQAAIGRARTLAGAPGLSAGQHKFWAGAAAGETRLLATLNKELITERAWRTMLGVSELGLDKEIRAAGSLPSLAKNVTGWKAQMGRDKATVAAISKMLGYSDAYIRAHPAAVPPVTGVQAIHTYGGDVANNIGTVLAAALGPFTGAARGGMVFDNGGTLRPGYNPVWNMTGRPESLVPARGGGGTHLHLTVNGPVGSPQQLEDWFIRTANKTAQHGRLTHAVKTASR